MADPVRAAVKLNPGEPKTILTAAGLTILSELQFGAYVVTAGHDTLDAARESLKGKYVYFSLESPVLIVPKGGEGFSATDPRLLQQGYLESMGITRAWTLTRGRSVRIGLLDTDFDPRTFELRRSWNRRRAAFMLKGKDFYELKVGKWFPAPRMRDDHGTICASLAVGGANSVNGVGVAPEATLVPVGLGLQVSTLMLAQALAYCADPHGGGCHVVSCSVGDLFVPEGSEVVLDAIQYLESQDVLLVYAVSNDGSTSLADDYVASDTRVMATASVDAFNNRVIGASGPGLTGVAHTDGISATSNGDVWKALPAGNSWSAPVIAGIVALLRAAEPNLTVAEVRKRIRETADDLGDPESFGSGLVRADRALGLPDVANPA